MKRISPLLVIATLTASVVAVPGIARDALPLATQLTLNLKDGATLYVFKDGKMAKEDRFGRAVYLQPGEVLDWPMAESLPLLATKSLVWTFS